MGLRNVRMSRTNHPVPRMYVPVQDTSGYNEVDYRDDSVLRTDTHPNPWSPNGANPRAPYPVVKGQGYHREMTVVGPRVKEPLAPPTKFRPFGSSKPSAKSMSPVTNQKYGVKLQGPPEAAETPMVKNGEGKVRGRQADKSSKAK